MPTPEERMMAFVEAEDTPPPAENAETPPPVETSQEPAAEQTDSTEGDQQTEGNQQAPEQRIMKLKHDGVEIEKPEEEVISLAQQGFDYTQKTQKLAEERKQVETYAQTLKAQEQAFAAQIQIQQALSQDIAKVTAMDMQLSQYQNVDWQALSNTDPVEAQKLFFSYTQLKTQREQAVSEVQKKQQEFSNVQNQSRAKQIELGRQVLEKEIPGWGKELAQSLVQTGKEYGFEDSELAGLTDPRAVRLLHDAAQWRKLQASKSAVDKKVSTASPVVKPGAKDTKNAASADIVKNREALKKTGKAEYAAKLIERTL